MVLYVYDQTYKLISIIENFFSLIWTERYYEAGEFELEAPLTIYNLSALVAGNYLRFEKSDVPMVIERIDISSDVEDGLFIRASGRSVSSLLSRRVLWHTEYANNVRLESFIYKILEDNVTRPSDTRRRLPIRFEKYTIPSTENISAQFTEYNVYDLIMDLCMAYGVGFKCTWPTDTDDGGYFVFSLYEGTDRTIGQSKTMPVIFSSEYDNLISSKYISSIANYCNTALVLGEDQGENRRRVEVNSENEGLNRFELLVDARDIQSEFEEGEEDPEGAIHIPTEDGEDIILEPDATYLPRLEERGIEKLSETSYIGEFSAEIEPDGLFVYGKHYFLGDTVSVDSGFGIVEDARITEYIFSIEENDYKAYPTLMLLNGG